MAEKFNQYKWLREITLTEDGHTDVASARRKLKLSIEDAQETLQSLEQMNSEEYEQYLLGNYKSKPKKKFESYVAPKNPYYRETPSIPSNGNGIGNCYKKENNTYTGTLITGIATMHKSNAVPITNKKQAIDVANMRRN